MSRFLRASVLLMLLAACGGGSRQYAAPRNLDDACAIIRERPQYVSAMKATERKWGVPVWVQMAVIHQESKFIGNAQTPHRFARGVIPLGRQSTAYDYSQALNGTRAEYQNNPGGRGANLLAQELPPPRPPQSLVHRLTNATSGAGDQRGRAIEPQVDFVHRGYTFGGQ